jgi:hypothetical protein
LWTSIRNLGTGLAMMPIITSGVSALPATLTISGTAVNNIMQRVMSSVAVALFGSLNSIQAAQLSDDEGSLLSTGANALPQLAAAEAKGPSGLLGIYEQMQAIVTTQTYDNSFYLITALSVVGAIIALLLMRTGKSKSASGTHPVEI